MKQVSKGKQDNIGATVFFIIGSVLLIGLFVFMACHLK